MNTILTAEDFLTLVLAKLSLTAPGITLADVDLDRRFEEAYEALLAKENEFGVRSNFTFYRDPLHGNTAKLRDALVSLRARKLIKPADQTRAVQLEIPADKANALLQDAPLPNEFLGTLVRTTFGDLAAYPGAA